MKLEIEGRQIEVDDSFGQLSPEDQQAQVNEIARSLQGHKAEQEKVEAKEQKAAEPVGMFDWQNPKSGVRQAIDPAIATLGGAAELAAEHPWITAGAAAMLPDSVLSKLPGGQKILAGKNILKNLGDAAGAYASKEARIANRPGFGGTPTTGPVNPTPTYNVPTQNVPTRAPVPSTGSVAPQNMANQVRQQAARRVIGMGAAVPAAVGLGGAALSTAAANQLANMTPEQRQAYYNSAMMGAMSGDTGLAAAIMNAGQ